MGNSSKITNELKIRNIIHLLYGVNSFTYTEGTRPYGKVLLEKEGGGSGKSFHMVNAEFLICHLGHLIECDYKRDLVSDLMGRPQNSASPFNGGGKKYMNRILQLATNQSKLQELIYLNYKLLENWDCREFADRVDEFLGRIIEAEAGEMGENRIEPEALEIYISYLQGILRHRDHNKENYARVLTWLILGALLRFHLNDPTLQAMLSEEMETGIRPDSFSVFIDSVASKEDDSENPMHYKNKDFRCFGRVDEFMLIDRFLESADSGPYAKSRFRWMAFTGKPGIGKSKLLYSYIRAEQRPRKEAFKKVMLSAARMDELFAYDSCYYPGNLLIVIDYAGKKPRTVGKWMEKLANQQNPYKIRLILLEREDTRGSAPNDTEAFWYKELMDGDVEHTKCLDACHFCHAPSITSYPLKGIGEKDCYSVIRQYKEKVFPDWEKENLDSGFDYKEVYRAAQRIEAGHGSEPEDVIPSPIFLMFTADAFLRENFGNTLDYDMITAYIHNRLFHYWEENTIFGGGDGQESPLETGKELPELLDHMKLLLFLTTCIGTQKIGDMDLSGLPAEFLQAQEAFRALSYEDKKRVLKTINMSRQRSTYLHALEPDLIGERHVIESFLSFADEKQIGRVTDYLLKNYPLEFRECMVRCMNDYYHVERFQKLFERGMRSFQINYTGLNEESASVWVELLLRLFILSKRDPEEMNYCNRFIDQVSSETGLEKELLVARVLAAI